MQYVMSKVCDVVLYIVYDIVYVIVYDIVYVIVYDIAVLPEGFYPENDGRYMGKTKGSFGFH